MDIETLNLIEGTAEKTADVVIRELRKNNLLVSGKQTPFQKIETLLFNYNNFKAVVEDKKEQIAEIQKYGLRKKSISISSFSTSDGMIEAKTEHDKVQDRIDEIMQSIQVTQNYIKIIDSALDQISDDPYYDIIRMRYFESQSRDDIADYFGCDPKTITRNKNRLVNLLQIRLFSDQVIKDLFTF